MVIISLIKSTGMTDSAPATIPSQNLRAPRGELSRYENIYPQMRMGRKVMITMGMSEKNAIGLFSEDFVFSELDTFPFSILKDAWNEKYVRTDEDEKCSDNVCYKCGSSDYEYSKKYKNNANKVHK